jgi:hypothetical protein
MTTDERPEGDSKLTRLTVNLIPKAAEALDHVAALTRDSKTDSVNRAIQLYDYLMERQAKGETVHLGRENSEGMVFQQIKLL